METTTEKETLIECLLREPNFKELAFEENTISIPAIASMKSIKLIEVSVDFTKQQGVIFYSIIHTTVEDGIEQANVLHYGILGFATRHASLEDFLDKLKGEPVFGTDKPNMTISFKNEIVGWKRMTIEQELHDKMFFDIG